MFIRFGNEGSGTSETINTDAIMRMSQVRTRKPDGTFEFSRILWFADGSHMKLSDQRADFLDSKITVDSTYTGA